MSWVRGKKAAPSRAAAETNEPMAQGEATKVFSVS